MPVKRFGVSLEENTLDYLDRFVDENNFPNRSQAIRFLIEQYKVDQKWSCNNIVAGAIVLLYDHHKRDIESKSTEIQHQNHHLVLSTQHVHLDHDLCLETITVRGEAQQLTQLADYLISLKGIIHGKLVMSRVKD